MNVKKPMMNWQSKRSVMPPWPGMESPKSLILKVRLRPEAKNPPVFVVVLGCGEIGGGFLDGERFLGTWDLPKGAIREAKLANTRVWNCMGWMWKMYL